MENGFAKFGKASNGCRLHWRRDPAWNLPSHIERAAMKLSLLTLVNVANAWEVSLDEFAFGRLKKIGIFMRRKSMLADCIAEEIAAITALWQKYVAYSTKSKE